MIERRPHNPTAYDDDWEDQPAQGWFYQWVLGVAVPVGIAWYAVAAIARREATFSNQNILLTLHGRNAVAFGIAWLSAAVFVHCHYFWGNIYDQAWFAVLGKIVAACGFIAGLTYVLIRNGLLGIS